MNVTVLNKAIGMMSLMKFFPGGDEARGALMELLGEMCANDEQVLWLAKRMRNLYPEWPGAHEMRAAFCARFSPKDGIEADSGSFPEGIPAERATGLQLPAMAIPELAAGDVSANLEANRLIRAISAARGMPKKPKGAGA